MRRKTGDELRHKVSGFTIVELLVVMGIIATLMALLIPAVQQVRESSRTIACINNIRQVALACHQFEGTYRVFPPGHSGPPLSWNEPDSDESMQQFAWTGHLGFLFPYLEQTPLHSSLDTDLWNRNSAGGPAWFIRPEVVRLTSRSRLAVLRCPSDTEAPNKKSIYAIQYPYVVLSDDSIGNGSTNYLGSSGLTSTDSEGLTRATGVFFSQSEVRPGDITDGLSTTLLIGEVLGDADEISPDFVTHRHAVLCGAIPVVNFWRLDTTDDMGPSYALIFRSRHRSFVNMAYADGSVRKISSNIDRAALKALGSIAGGEVASSEF